MTARISCLAACCFALCLGLGLSSCRSRTVAQGNHEPRQRRAQTAHPVLDPELAAAERAAIDKLAEFRAALEHPAEAAQNFEIEAVIDEGALAERLWLREVRPSKDGFEGSVSQQPKLLKSVQQGQELHVPTAQVVDWAFEDRGKPRGGETRLIAMRRKRAAELADALRTCNADGCTALGEQYAKGLRGEVRPDVAFQLFSKGCAGGSPLGCNAAGWASVHGRGTTTDMSAAAGFFAKACATGSEHPFACDSRGFALVSGLAGTVRDLALGQRLLRKACASGVSQSCLLLELMRAKHLRAGPKLKLACEVNFSEQVSLCTGEKDPEACFLAGSAFEVGACDAPRSKARSAELLARAAEFGASWPQAPAQLRE